jgi:hypothetical protein
MWTEQKTVMLVLFVLSTLEDVSHIRQPKSLKISHVNSMRSLSGMAIFVDVLLLQIVFNNTQNYWVFELSLSSDNLKNTMFWEPNLLETPTIH